MELKPGYKQTEVGVIPEDWDCVSLGSFAQVSTGGTPSRSNPLYWNGLIPWITTAEIDYHQINGTNEYITADGLSSSAARLLPPGVLLMAMYGQGKTRGKVAITSIAAATNQACAGIGLEEHISSGFIFYWLANQYHKIRNLSNTGNQENLNLNLIRSILCPLPPSRNEQNNIFEMLVDIDSSIAAIECLAEKKRQIKQAAMQELLTGKRRLPGFEGEWEVKRLGDIAALNRNNIVPALYPDKLFTHYSLPAFDAEKAALVEAGASIGSNKFTVPASAVLVSKLNPRIPRAWAPEVVPANAVASTEWLILTPNDGIDRNYLFAVCCSPAFCEQMELAATGTTGSHQRISPSIALDIKINVTPLRDEQVAISSLLSDMDSELSILYERLQKARELKQGMLQQLLTGKIRLR